MKRILIAASLLAVLAAGCGSSGGGNLPPGGGSGVTLPRTTRANWTVLVYMNAANNLEPFSVENVDQMEQASYSSDVNVVLQWKRWHGENQISEDAAFDPNSPEWDGTRRYWLTGQGPAGSTKDEVEDLGSGPVNSVPSGSTVDMGDWHSLQNFIQWGQANFPADHYLVVLWNHGAGWEHRAVARTIPHRGLSYDDQSGSSIETWQLQLGLAAPRPLDVVAVDCSLMQMLEVTYQMRNVATYAVGSEDSPPGDGYPYQLWVPALTSNPTMDPLSAAKLISDTFASFYQNNTDSGGNQDSVTQSVVATSALPAVAQALSALGDALYANRTQYASAFAQARDSATEYALEGTSQSSIYPEYKDMTQYAMLLKQYAPNAPGVSQAADNLIAAENQAVLDNHGIRADSFSHGLSIYVPVAASAAPPPQSYDSTYTNLDLAHDTSWPKWLQNQAQ